MVQATYLVEGAGDGLFNLFLQLLVVLDALLALPSNVFTDSLGGGLSIDPSGPPVVGPVQVHGILTAPTGGFAALCVRS